MRVENQSVGIGGSLPLLERLPGYVRWHFLFGVIYTLAVLVSVSATYSGSHISIVWPPVGVAVWWAAISRDRRTFALVVAVVFLVPALYLGVVSGHPPAVMFLAGLSHVIAGPGIVLAMAIYERLHPARNLDGGVGRSSPLDRIAIPHDVYRLLVSSLIMIPMAKLLSMVGVGAGGGDLSFVLLTSFILRDLAGVIAVAGAGMAIVSAHAFRPANLREFVVALVVSAVLLFLIFSPTQAMSIVYLAMLPLYWSATRFPVSLALLHSVATALAASVLADVEGTDAFGSTDDTAVAQAATVHLFVIMCLLLSLVVSTTVQQHSVLIAEREALTSTIPDALLTIDRDDRVVPINSAAREVVQSRPEGGYELRPVLQAEDSAVPKLRWLQEFVLQGEYVQGVHVKLGGAAPDGEGEVERIYAVSASPLYGPGDAVPDHALLLYHDITNQYLAMQALREARDEAHLLFEYSPHGVATLDSEGRILQANESLGELVGMSPDELRGRRLSSFSVDGDLRKEITAASGAPGTAIQADRSLECAGGRRRKVALSLRSMSPEYSASAPVLVNAVDITEREELHELVAHMADHDALTGLFNRRRLEPEFDCILERSANDNSDGALLLIDLDKFKVVNDTLGHQAGDELLVEIAGILRDCVRVDDVVARLGGDEFVVVMADTDHATATDIGARIVDVVQLRFGSRPAPVNRVSVSIGIAMFSEAREQGIDPLVLADQLLYDAKRTGRNRLVSFDADTRVVRPAEREETRSVVKRILAQQALRIELQPIADAQTERIVGAEGLVRVAYGEDPIAPGELVATAEQMGLVTDLDTQVFRMGIALLPELSRIFPGFRLSLNLSAQSLQCQEVAEAVVAELQKHDVAPGSLLLEVTESEPIEDPAAAVRFQRTVAAAGVELALDDFGVGHDPYRYLKQLDFSVLKIDGEFVQGMTDDGVDRAVVRSIVGLAEERGMVTVAEFVSGERILSAVQEAGVTFAQGFHVGASLPPEEFIATHLRQYAKETGR